LVAVAVVDPESEPLAASVGEKDADAEPVGEKRERVDDADAHPVADAAQEMGTPWMS